MSKVWVILILIIPFSVFAQSVPIPAPPQLGSDSYMLIDFLTGQVIVESSPDEVLEPASLTKLMTAYAAFKALEQGQISLDDQVYVSEKAWRTDGSRMFIEVGTYVSVEDLFRGMIIQSGNDASVALSEHVAGSEEAFAGLMNQHAQLLGMSSSSFRNSTGLPSVDHYTTARDTAVLTRAIISEFPSYYSWYSERDFTYNDITQQNRNSLLWRDSSVDGLKTGYTDAAGYCLVTSAQRSGMRLITVVMGADSPEARATDSQALLNYGFRFYETHKLYSKGEEVTTSRVWKGDPESVSMGVTEDFYLTMPRGSYDSLSALIDVQSDLMAPLQMNSPVGYVRVSLDEEQISELPLVALHDVPNAGLWVQLKDQIMLWAR
jgi:serine-type D-Ala-D-Ala carboxypeptidase (penicillin-binding protein 5/6)